MQVIKLIGIEIIASLDGAWSSCFNHHISNEQTADLAKKAHFPHRSKFCAIFLLYLFYFLHPLLITGQKLVVFIIIILIVSR